MKTPDDTEHRPLNTPVRFTPVSYDHSDSQASATRIVQYVRPEWGSDITISGVSGGLNNILLKAMPGRPGKLSGAAAAALDAEAILLRSYGAGTDAIIDRDREVATHALLNMHSLAPELLGRFENGILYRFVPGRPATPDDLRRPAVFRAVARELAAWHAKLPVDAEPPYGKAPDVLGTARKWIDMLPAETEAQRDTQKECLEAMEYIREKVVGPSGLGVDGNVFCHCDLLSANIIILPEPATADPERSPDAGRLSVMFIDYEYGMPSPAAFDLANHFAEWAGLDCDFSLLPTRAERAAFITEYLVEHHRILGSRPVRSEDVDGLMAEVDLWRGVPGFFWGVWAHLRATTADINFNYTEYAGMRLDEYRDWKAELDGSRERDGKEMPLRERRWAQHE